MGLVADCFPLDAALVVVDLGDGTCQVLVGLAGDLAGDCTQNIFGGLQCTHLDSDLFIIAANEQNLSTDYIAPDFQAYFDAIGIGSIVALSAHPASPLFSRLSPFVGRNCGLIACPKCTKDVPCVQNVDHHSGRMRVTLSCHTSLIPSWV